MAEIRASWAGFSREDLLKIFHHPAVRAHIVKKAQETVANTGHPEGFSVQLRDNPNQIRPRAWIVPNSKGIHLELKDGVLLKACLGMSGK